MRALLTSLVLASFGAAGCGGGTACTTLYAYGLSVTVVRASDGAPVYDATVTITDGAYRETAMAVFGRRDGGAGTGVPAYVGAGERAGEYAITVSAPGYATETRRASVSRDECHVRGVALTVPLTPG